MGESTMNAKQAAVDSLRKEMVMISKKIFARGLTSGMSGNLSARVPGFPEQILIKATGKCFGDVQEDDFVLVDCDGTVMSAEGKPSKEVYFHCGIYKERQDVNAVLHGHSVYATAYVTARGELPTVTVAAAAGLQKIAVVEFAAAGSAELAKMVIEAFRDKTLKAAVLKKHGFVTAGADIYKAFYLGDVLEENAKGACIMAQL